MKYIVVRNCPVKMYGSSTSRALIHVRITVFVIVQNTTWLMG